VLLQQAVDLREMTLDTRDQLLGERRHRPSGVPPIGKHRARRRAGDVGLVQDVERGSPGLAPGGHAFTRSMLLARARVDLDLFALFHDSGTCTTRPVSSFAGL